MPLLFSGEGTLGEVVKFHANFDKRALTGPPGSLQMKEDLKQRDFVPNTVLGGFKLVGG